ncbi:MAG: hypothetical protein LBG48_02320 [Rickettsiales bacterium]|jgi:hypothetical protein|nr:hypothetical protein [Rickettsiales bacterium]
MMTPTEKEIIKIFTDLSPENQHTLLMYARVAHTAEGAIRKAVSRALGGEEIKPLRESEE